MRRGTFGHTDTQKKVLCGDGKQRLEWCLTKPKSAKDRQQPLEETRGEKIGSPSRVLREKLVLLIPWLQTSNLQNAEKIHFYCYKPPSLWYFVTSAQGNSSLLALWGKQMLKLTQELKVLLDPEQIPAGQFFTLFTHTHPHPCPWVPALSTGPQGRSRLCPCFALPKSQRIRARALQTITFPELVNYL